MVSKTRQPALDTVVLALELLKRIPRGRKITASELHEQLQSQGLKRDLRSIQRQLEALGATACAGHRWRGRSGALASHPHPACGLQGHL